MSDKRCNKCGAELASEGSGSICPRCAMEFALGGSFAEEVSDGETLGSRARSGEPSVDRYELIRKLGEGGMGEVWLAQQREPVQRQVAVKIIKRGMDSEVFVARFERERQALALMSHPAVARIFDAGATEAGLPYFVMEYVQGEPINEHCTKHGLSMEERLELFRQVCEGVHHAHQKAIVHRDLKPSNVLVTREAGRSHAKIIDFGVAKALGKELSDQTLFTELGVLVGTPEYMSPEQALAGDEAIDTRTDVYSLGVMLYELLSGALPFDSKRLREAGYEGIRQVILEEEPPRPSTRIATLGGDGRSLRGDLDWITMKALEKEPDRRYSSAAEFAADIARHMHAEPVLAGPPSASYRAGKFVRRHRGAVATSAAIVFLLVAGLVSTTTLWRDAQSQRRLAEERFDRVIQLSDLKRVQDYTAAAEELWPAHPENVVALEAWLVEKGEPLAASLEGHRATLESLRAQALPYDDAQRQRDIDTHPESAMLKGHRVYIEEKLELIPRLLANDTLEDRDELVKHYEERIEESRAEVARLEDVVRERRTWLFPDNETQWEHDMLEALVGQIEIFVDGDPFVGALQSVRERLDFARSIEEISVRGPDAAAAWEEATRAIAASPYYGGLQLAPQMGLVPLGEDPATGLWEFWHVASGDEPLKSARRDRENPWRISEPTGMVFVLVPGGTFWMGAQASDPQARNYDPQAHRREGGVHDVTLAPFFMSKYEMTQAQWLRLTGSNPSRNDPGTEFLDKVVDGTHPVEMVSWEEATELMRRHALALPTEAQWEYAARAGTSTPWWTGSDPLSLRGAENVADQSFPRSGAPASIAYEPAFDDGYVTPAPVGTFRPNPFGLFDVLGNVSELCREHYQSPYRGTERPGDGYVEVPIGTRSHVYRGGNWRATTRLARAFGRSLLPLENEDSMVGLRPARLIEGTYLGEGLIPKRARDT